MTAELKAKNRTGEHLDWEDSNILQGISRISSSLEQCNNGESVTALLDAFLSTCPFFSRSEFQDMEKEKGEPWHRLHCIYSFVHTSGCTRQFCRLLEECREDMGAMGRCSFILWHLSRNADNRQEMLSLGTHRALVQLMEESSQHLNVVVHSLGLLWNLSAEPDYRNDIIASRAADMLLDFMHTHEEVAPVQENAIGALINLSLNIDFERCKGYVSPLLSVMSRHTSSPLIQENSCWFLCNMNDDSIRSYIVEHGGVQCVLRCLQVHEEDARVQEKGLWALCSFACDGASSCLIVASGGVEVIVRAMTRFAHNETIVCYACWTLKNVAAVSKDVCVDIAREGVVPVVLELLRGQGGKKRGGWSDETLEQFFSLIRNLAFHDDVRAEIVKRKGIARILKSLPRVQAAATKASSLAALCNLVKQEDESIVELVRRKGVEAVLLLMTSDCCLDIHKFGCILLYSLSRERESCKLRVIRAGGVEVLKEAIKQHGHEQTVRDCAVQTLRNLCYNDKMEMRIQQETNILLARASHPLQVCLLP
ncbi:hypothetical protein GUITHDRAFT_118649 [Guillardia theta CCMP2712]|uniref:Uncharacterized protein n=1 Tax=Guillardia theta (strain CCMP2712) TaxID=905079 RepID=L1IH05_GUITC|nr:hypothetical protein GUITHDRAFT_118649 [Guillardia theta CCMP2712]EKX35204.1 hypothetical protein GUITHDRAFT_118649 [Guillardia theta CCMP2712]|eukprot:XP_005822184.1 hypothetical protein GUITHDRAFT_118649 [Guillardia theta CCMP2712]